MDHNLPDYNHNGKEDHGDWIIHQDLLEDDSSGGGFSEDDGTKLGWILIVFAVIFIFAFACGK